MNLDVTMVTCGQIALFNAYMPGNKHAARLPLIIEKQYADTSAEAIPENRNYLVLEIGGSDADGADFQMPPIKYIFAWAFCTKEFKERFKKL